MSEQLDWCCLGDVPLAATQDIWHAVRPGSTTTVCGLPVADPDEEWRWADKIGSRRPCDNCTRILAQEGERPPGWKPKLGLLPQIPDRPVLMLRPEVVELAAPPLEVHNLEKIADPDMLGNDTKGDCVAVAIENDRRCSRAALGLPLNKLTAAQVVANYFKMTGGPDAGLVAQLALEWVRKNGWPGCTDKLLVFARVNIALTPIRQTVAEFLSGLFCVEIDASQEYPEALWAADNSAYRGGHGIAGGTYTQAYTMVKTWGYIASMTPSYVAQKVNEFDVLVWDFQWAALTYDRQVQLVTDYQALTGKTWTGPAPVPPAPTPEAEMQFLHPTFRAFDGALAANTPKTVFLQGVGGIASNAVGVSAVSRVVNPQKAGFVNVGSTPVDFDAAKITDGFPIVALTNGALVLTATQAVPRFVLDITGFFV